MIKARKSAEYEAHDNEECKKRILKDIIDKQILTEMDNFEEY